LSHPPGRSRVGAQCSSLPPGARRRSGLGVGMARWGVVGLRPKRPFRAPEMSVWWPEVQGVTRHRAADRRWRGLLRQPFHRLLEGGARFSARRCSAVLGPATSAGSPMPAPTRSSPPESPSDAHVASVTSRRHRQAASKRQGHLFGARSW
jgi:hypothetical protein